MSRMSFSQDQIGNRQGFGQPQGGQQVMRGAPPQNQQQLPGFGGISVGGRTTLGDMSYEAPDSSSVYQSFMDALARQNVAGTQAGSNNYMAELQQMSQDLGSRLGLEGTKYGVDGTNYQSDNSLEASKYNTDAGRYASENQLAGLQYGIDADERNTDLTSGRSLEGVRYGVDGNVDIANIGANSARDVADIGNERYRIEDAFNQQKLSRYDDTLASLTNQGGGMGGGGMPSGSYAQGDPQEAMNRAYAQSAGDRAAMENQVANSGGSPQASAYGARAAQQEAMTNAQNSYAIPQAFRQENNENRFAELAAMQEARRSQNSQQGNLLGFLSGLIG